MNLDTLSAALSQFSSSPFLEATKQLFREILHIPLSPLAETPIDPERFFGEAYREKKHEAIQQIFLTGKITDDSFSSASNSDLLGKNWEALSEELDHAVDYQGLLIFSVDLGDHELLRSELATLTRDINRKFPTPVIVVFKHASSSRVAISFGVASRRNNLKDSSKHVLGKISMIRDVMVDSPHHGHLDLLSMFALENMKQSAGRPVTSFRTFHAALEKIFDVELLNKRFYKELANWYFWAMQECRFPFESAEHNKDDLLSDSTKVREHDAKNLIRLLTRTLFVWFIKERGLVPDAIFQPHTLKNSLLKGFNPESKETNYYKAILQNLFFATLNQTHGKREFRKEGQHMNTTNLLRYQTRLQSPDDFITLLEAHTPFLNGGLFECLDYPHPTKKGRMGGAVIVYEDGFSDRKDNPLELPDFLFFGTERNVDLSGTDAYGVASKKNEKVRGLINILDSFKFTIVENTPIDQEIALDPELLGQVFENLLASYNPETKTTARKQTGSFYTPRPIVDYMVDESLKAHLSQALQDDAGMEKSDADAGLDTLFAYTEQEHAFSSGEVAILIRAIDSCKILDPACGSGAFPMGVLQKLVYILSKLDPDNERWKQTQLDKLDSAPMREALESDFEDNDDDYGRKLYLIENCLYGVDIQSIATQVSKLRFFISLIVDQRVDQPKENFGVRPLPNLETKFVTADTLIKLDNPDSQGQLAETADISELKRQLKRVRHNLFTAKTPKTKNKYREQDKELREQIATELEANGWGGDSAQALADWDPYNQNASSHYFDPEWMFGVTGFDIVIGNPPYVTYKGKQSVNVSDEYVAKIKQLYPDSATYKINSFAVFLEKGIQELGPNKILAFIIPSTILQNEYLEKIRQLILSQNHLSSVLVFQSKVFKSVTDSIVVLIKKTGAPSNLTKVTTSSAIDFSDLYNKPQTYDSRKWLASHSSIINTRITEQESQIIEKIEEDTIHLEQYVNVYVGIVASGIKKFLSNSKLTDNHKKYLQGRHIGRFSNNPNGIYINFEKEKLHSNTDETVYLQKQKILVRKTGKILLAYLDKDQYYVDQSIYCLYQKSKNSPNLAAIACILNACLLNFYFNKKMITNPDVFPYIKGIHLKILPIAQLNEIIEVNLTKLYFLANLCKTNNISSFRFLEELIDACVMECYFRDHMAELDLLFHDQLAPHLESYDPEATEFDQLNDLQQFHDTLGAPDSEIRQKLNRIESASPDLLAVIKREGKV